MIVVTGATGQLATAFRLLVPDARFLTRDDLDLSQPDGVGRVLDRLRPELLINCAAYTAVDAAESDEATAEKVNALSVGEMAAWTSGHGAKLVTFSTDYVFDGRESGAYLESSPTNPTSAYGRTKLAGERLVGIADPYALIVRTSWVISGTHSNFVSTMLDLVGERELQVVDDQRGCPTVTDDLASATMAAIGAGATGLLHLTNSGATTWFGLARAAVGLAGFDPDRISPCSTDQFPRPARRPPNSELGSERTGQLGLTPLPGWEESLPKVVAATMERLSSK